MALEIERKFLVTGDGWCNGCGVRLTQGYLNRDKDRTVRIRLAGEKAFITVKGVTSGAARAEFEYAIPPTDAEQLLKLCDGPIVDKIRYTIEHAGFEWEVDEFLGDNLGLVVAEIELKSEEQKFDLPNWVGREVTDDPRFFNSNLATNPYRNWCDQLT